MKFTYPVEIATILVGSYMGNPETLRAVKRQTYHVNKPRVELSNFEKELKGAPRITGSETNTVRYYDNGWATEIITQLLFINNEPTKHSVISVYVPCTNEDLETYKRFVNRLYEDKPHDR